MRWSALRDLNYPLSSIPFGANVSNFLNINLYLVILFALDKTLLCSMIVLVSRFRSALVWLRGSQMSTERKVWLAFIVAIMAVHMFVKWLLWLANILLTTLKCRRDTTCNVHVEWLLKVCVLTMCLQDIHRVFPHQMQQTTHEYPDL